MNLSASSPSARASLRRLATPHALDFGCRLLQGHTDGVLTFRSFVSVARQLIAERPEQTAVFLAALVALDMGSADSISEADEDDDGRDADRRGTDAPSRN